MRCKSVILQRWSVTTDRSQSFHCRTVVGAPSGAVPPSNTYRPLPQRSFTDLCQRKVADAICLRAMPIPADPFEWGHPRCGKGFQCATKNPLVSGRGSSQACARAFASLVGLSRVHDSAFLNTCFFKCWPVECHWFS